MISVSRLTKRYGPVLAVSDVSFEVERGAVVGFLGPNGAGKSTTLRILAGFLGMTSGRVTIAGFDIEDDSVDARRSMGYMPEAVPLYTEMRVREYLDFRAELKRVPRGERRARVGDAMKKANVADMAEVVIGKLSKGYRQRVGLADALVANPPLLILDEPTAGLDPNQIREVRDVVRALGKEHTVLLSTHILSEVEATCDRVIVIAKGKLVAQGRTAEIAKMRRPRGLLVTLRGDGPKAQRLLKGLPGIGSVTVDASLGSGEDTVTTLSCALPKSLPAEQAAAFGEKVAEALLREGLHLRELRPLGSSLEEVFTELTRQGTPADGAQDGAKEEGEA